MTGINAMQIGQGSNRHVLRINMGTEFVDGGGNSVFSERQRELEVSLHKAAGMRWSADGGVLFDAYRVGHPVSVAPSETHERVRLLATSGSTFLVAEVEGGGVPPKTASWVAMAQFVTHLNIAGWGVDRLLGESRSMGFRTDHMTPLPPQYWGEAAFIVLGRDAGNGDRMVAAFEHPQQAQDYRRECWEDSRSPTSPPIAVPLQLRGDRKQLVAFLESVGRAETAVAAPAVAGAVLSDSEVRTWPGQSSIHVVHGARQQVPASLERSDDEHLGVLQASIESLCQEVEQMRGMFKDGDGTTAAALHDAEEAFAILGRLRGRLARASRDGDVAPIPSVIVTLADSGVQAVSSHPISITLLDADVPADWEGSTALLDGERFQAEHIQVDVDSAVVASRLRQVEHAHEIALAFDSSMSGSVQDELDERVVDTVMARYADAHGGLDEALLARAESEASEINNAGVAAQVCEIVAHGDIAALRTVAGLDRAARAPGPSL